MLDRDVDTLQKDELTGFLTRHSLQSALQQLADDNGAFKLTVFAVEVSRFGVVNSSVGPGINMIHGVTTGWSKELELVGVGYRASNQGNKLDMALGFSHNIILDIAPEVKVETVSEKGKNPIIKLTSFDKQLVGQVAAKIRGFRKPEPYKGKGIKFVGEEIRRKAGKSA